MGTDHNLYFGPYVKCKRIYVTTEHDVTGCPKCKQEHTVKFCPDCGAECKVFKKSKSKELKVDTYELTEKLAHRITEIYSDTLVKGYDVFIPNVKIKGIKRKDNIDAKFGDASLINVYGTTVLEETKLFIDQFAKELDALKEEYGDYEVGWGVIFWYS